MRSPLPFPCVPDRPYKILLVQASKQKIYRQKRKMAEAKLAAQRAAAEETLRAREAERRAAKEAQLAEQRAAAAERKAIQAEAERREKEAANRRAEEEKARRRAKAAEATAAKKEAKEKNKEAKKAPLAFKLEEERRAKAAAEVRAQEERAARLAAEQEAARRAEREAAELAGAAEQAALREAAELAEALRLSEIDAEEEALARRVSRCEEAVSSESTGGGDLMRRVEQLEASLGAAIEGNLEERVGAIERLIGPEAAEAAEQHLPVTEPFAAVSLADAGLDTGRPAPPTGDDVDGPASSVYPEK
ncbi:hypothetical protein EMIHUDRAFT_205881 [Emiliania huxleyi CCMP1516]|uniref:Uncharacterized protein n=2 Tax=Emiliania huxleyi TaxID=2903 RepID=A0A0D3JQI0_EMIH1|nr:hypothetical protein EMIHUDRAFT_205881 [Emiliania huxleyi CCMP1516]EOD25765.1 hypothetical protein EMIHUDRAFT_205881 [Emiliania huxleyi CCMP1516]|eukprot:XP_005778194.1 hypothetical protein EMIHUDRAFT_205881 [Emiliania huxleyi CCMP1516]